jgi:hypothetical protein
VLSVKLVSELKYIKNTIQKEKTYKLDDTINHNENLQYSMIHSCMYFIFYYYMRNILFIFMFLMMLNLYHFLFFSFTLKEQSLLAYIQRKVNKFCHTSKTYPKVASMKKDKKQELKNCLVKYIDS